MIFYSYTQYAEILKRTDNSLLIPDSILSNTPIISYNHWQKVNKVKPDYIANISMSLNRLTNDNIDDIVKEIKQYLQCKPSKLHFNKKIIDTIIVNNYYCKLYIDFIKKLNISIDINSILIHIDTFEKELNYENLMIKDKLIGLIKFICISINNNTYKLEDINKLLDKYFEIIHNNSELNGELIYIYADIIKSIFINLDKPLNKIYLDKAKSISKDLAYKTRLRFIFLDVCDLSKKSKLYKR